MVNMKKQSLKEYWESQGVEVVTHKKSTKQPKKHSLTGYEDQKPVKTPYE